MIVSVEAAGPDVSQARQLRSSSGDNFSDALGMDWTPDGRLVYVSQASGNLEIWAIAANGQSERQLTRDPSSDLLPATSITGRHIVFVSDRSVEVTSGEWILTAATLNS
jgi:Tol biopolymer transport system component